MGARDATPNNAGENSVGDDPEARLDKEMFDASIPNWYQSKRHMPQQEMSQMSLRAASEIGNRMA